MSKSQETFNKKEREKKRLKKKQEKLKRREERKDSPSSGGSLDDMIAYVDEDGKLTDTPPDPMAKKKIIDASTIEISVPKGGKEVMPTERNGKVDFYNDAKGFGFIRESGTQEKYFFHVNGLIDEVRENDKVTFELEPGLKGLNAVRVKKM